MVKERAYCHLVRSLRFESQGHKNCRVGSVFGYCYVTDQSKLSSVERKQQLGYIVVVQLQNWIICATSKADWVAREENRETESFLFSQKPSVLLITQFDARDIFLWIDAFHIYWKHLKSSSEKIPTDTPKNMFFSLWYSHWQFTWRRINCYSNVIKHVMHTCYIISKGLIIRHKIRYRYLYSKVAVFS